MLENSTTPNAAPIIIALKMPNETDCTPSPKFTVFDPFDI
jgi:hypothetical protein